MDAVILPRNLLDLLTPAPAFLAVQPVIGLWPASAAATIDTLLQRQERHSVQRFAELVGARKVDPGLTVPNVNTPADLSALLGP